MNSNPHYRKNLLFLLVLFLTIFPLLSSFVSAEEKNQPLPDQIVTDPDTSSTVKTDPSSTRSAGEILTDKSVRKEPDSGFEVILSALSSTCNTTQTVQSSVPVDIILVLDVSGSMNNPLSASLYRKNPKAVPARIEELKTAVIDLLDLVAEKNDALTDSDLKHRVSLVKFAGKSKETLGNDFYTDNYYQHNYTQIVKDFKSGEYCEGAVKEDLIRTVNSLRAAGATSADYALNHAKTLLKKAQDNDTALRKQNNPQQVIIFFTDGEPNHYSSFDDKVAADTVNIASSLKSQTSKVYSIGMFDAVDSKPLDLFMSAVSSNYPQAFATAENGFHVQGEPVETKYYQKVSDNPDLSTIFENILNDITTEAGSYPTHVENGQPYSSGYITFTDTLGKYMRVKEFRSVVYNKTEYPVIKKNENTFVVSPSVSDETASLMKYIKISTSYNEKDCVETVTAAIPAALIPLTLYDIHQDTDGTLKGTVAEADPVQIRYAVTLDAKVQDQIRKGTADDPELIRYMNSHKNDQRQIVFYANTYPQKGVKAEFVPAARNSFYHKVLYRDPECTVPVSSGHDAPCYRKYYLIDPSGNAHVKIQRYSTPEEARDSEKTTGKSINTTATHPYVTENHFTGDTAAVFLGNNGRISLSCKPQEITVDPDETGYPFHVDKKLEGKDWTPSDSFEFILTAVGNAPLPEQSILTLTVQNHSGNFGSVRYETEGIYRYRLTEKYPAAHEITGITYSRAEYEITVTVSKQEEKLQVSSSILQLKDDHGADSNKEVAQAVFTNTFYNEPAKLGGDTAVRVRKIISGRNWNKEDHFEFTLALTKGNPEDVLLPPALTITADKDHPEAVFEEIRFRQPGEYQFTISEVEGDIPGLVYDSSPALITVQVSDKGKGQLIAETEGNPVTFTNVYSAEPAVLTGSTYLNVKKTIRGYNQEWPSGGFTFLLSPVDHAPMPDSDTLTITEDTPQHQAHFNDILFTEPGFYAYTIREQIPAVPVENMTYSSEIYTIQVHVREEKGQLKIHKTTLLNSQNMAVEQNISLFSNSYDPKEALVSGEASLRVEKSLSSDSERLTFMPGESFTFILEPEFPSNPMPESNILTLTASGGKETILQGHFPDILFNAEGKYNYVIKELIPQPQDPDFIAGMKYADNEYDVRITVSSKDNEGQLSGQLHADVQISDGTWPADSAHFVNRLWNESVVLDGSASLAVHKILIDSTNTSLPLNGHSFTFSIVGSEGAPMPQPSRITLNGDLSDSAFFNDITFTDIHANRTFSYTIREIGEDSETMEYSKMVYTVIVSVTRGKEDKLFLNTGMYNNEGKPVPEAEFINRKLTPVDPEDLLITGRKYLNNNLSSKAFRFKTTAVGLSGDQITRNVLDDAILNQTENENQGLIGFYLDLSTTGNHIFEIQEINEGENNYQYDPSLYSVVVQVQPGGKNKYQIYKGILPDEAVRTILGFSPADPQQENTEEKTVILKSKPPLQSSLPQASSIPQATSTPQPVITPSVIPQATPETELATPAPQATSTPQPVISPSAIPQATPETELATPCPQATEIPELTPAPSLSPVPEPTVEPEKEPDLFDDILPGLNMPEQVQDIVFHNFFTEPAGSRRICIQKKWILDNGGHASSSVSFELSAPGMTSVIVTLNSSNHWYYEQLLPDADWSVSEINSPAGFSTTVMKEQTEDRILFTITNNDLEPPVEPTAEPDIPAKEIIDEHTPETADISGKQKWLSLFLLSALILLIIRSRKNRG